MGATIVRGHDLDVLAPPEIVPVFVFDAGVGEAHVSVVARQVVLARPPRDLFGLTIRPAVAVLPAAIALVQEPLIVALELVVENHSLNSAALVSNTLLSALVGPIDLGVMRQRARLSEARIEGLAGFPRAFLAREAIRFEQIPAPLCQDDGPVVCAEWCGVDQPLVLEVLETAARALRVLTDVVKVALGDDPKCTATPLPLMSLRRAENSFEALGSRPEVGSSSSGAPASFASAIAISTFCRMPFE
jgi:hypothetical protein